MNEAALSRRYAKALFEIAKGKEDVFETQLNEFHALWLNHEGLRGVLLNRFIDLNARLKVIDDLAAKIQMNLDVIHFLKLLIRKGRMGYFGMILESFHEFALQAANKVEASITSAKPLPEATYTELQNLMAQKTGKMVVVKKEINPDVLGGVCIRVGNEIYDGTVKAELDRLCDSMAKVSF